MDTRTQHSLQLICKAANITTDGMVKLLKKVNNKDRHVYNDNMAKVFRVCMDFSAANPSSWGCL